MKNLLRIPTPITPDKDNAYGFIETEFEGTADEAWAEYKRLTNLMIEESKPQPVNAMAPREFDELCEEYYEKGQLPGGVDSLEKFSTAQNAVIKTITRIIRKRN